jgi:uncharacterized membrane protein YesL
MGIFDPDSRFSIITNDILDYIKISLLFLLFSIPLITIVPAAAAGMKVVVKKQLGEAPAVYQPFKKGFKENAKQGIPVSLLFWGVVLILYFDWKQILQMETGGIVTAVRVTLLLLSLLFAMVFLYIPPMMARYRLSLKAIIHNSVIYAILNFARNLLALGILLVGFLLLTYVVPLVPLTVVAIPALMFFYMGRICTKIFVKLEGTEPNTEETEESDSAI